MSTPTFEGIKGYATPANAQKKLDAVFGGNCPFTTLIAVAPQADGKLRFVPVVVYSEGRDTKHEWCAGTLAHAGLYVTN